MYMNPSRIVSALLLSGSLALLTGTAVAQSGSATGTGGSSATGSGSGGSQNSGASRQTITPMTSGSSSSSQQSLSGQPSPAGQQSTSGQVSSTRANVSGQSGSSDANTNANAQANASFYGPGASQFKNIDHDHDGRISRTEFINAGTASMNLDTNNDGTVSADEKAAGKDKKHWWNRNKADNQSASSSEVTPSESFTQLDADKDGFLSQSELASANAQLKK